MPFTLPVQTSTQRVSSAHSNSPPHAREKKTWAIARVHVRVFFVPPPIGRNRDGFALKVNLNVESVDDEEVLTTAHNVS
ncbi:hypothetical protein EW146_g9175 [Bondarzewia mesenterica]|uniref:Uncharacterized protein n=1 Tax=Bondarzewia mesenterica TaxID=1095465 RepID=A0A4S4L8D4_9AGAM|nr:hypothetical protein EW146_g9175 [Bondarzewia mesenterica]